MRISFRPKPRAFGRRRGRDRRSLGRGTAWSVATGLAMALLALPACGPGLVPEVTLPPAESYDVPSNFAGVWVGEADGAAGTLEVEAVGESQYRGVYTGDDDDIEYTLTLEQDMVPAGETTIAGNRATFHWQDDQGIEGEGWLLINREDSALTGAFGERGILDRPLTFIRVE